jgi:hypothetical protein
MHSTIPFRLLCLKHTCVQHQSFHDAWKETFVSLVSPPYDRGTRLSSKYGNRFLVSTIADFQSQRLPTAKPSLH